LPHVPQLALLVCRFTQTIPFPIIPPPGHSVSPVAQPAVHEPATQVLSGGQRLPHPPQLRGSVSVSVQFPLQLVSPPPQTHAPFVQHALLQFVVPPVQLVVHTPCEQTWPDAHTVPQPPQLFGSLCESVQTPLQRTPLL
jgi:hypothetical protein